MYWKLLTSLLFTAYAWGGVTGREVNKYPPSVGVVSAIRVQISCSPTFPALRTLGITRL